MPCKLPAPPFPWQRFGLATFAILAALCRTPAAGPPARLDGTLLRGITPTLPRLLETAERIHPAIEGAGTRVTAQEHRANAVDGFYDPQLGAGLLYADGPLRASESYLPGYVESDSLAARGTAGLAVDPGVYVRASLTHWQRFDAPSYADGHATVAGLAVQIPLLKDRGFETHHLTRQYAGQQTRTLLEQQRTIRQNVRMNVTAAYIALLRAQAAYQETLSASNRAARILHETNERVSLTANAAYELHTARMEVALRTDDACNAQNTRQQTLTTLLEAIGLTGSSLAPATEPNELHDWAGRVRAATATNAAPALRPEIAALLARREELRTAEQLAETACQSDLSLRAGLGWRIDDNEWAYNDGKRFGWEAGLVWSRPLGLTAERETLHAARAEHLANLFDTDALNVQIHSEIQRAHTALDSALQRFEIVRLAVDEARLSLDAEEERFRLGEGRSRNVLDAQKDLTTANLRSHDVAAELLRAHLDLAYALGQLAPGE